MNKFFKNEAGFTLIEVTVTILVFSIMMTLVAGIFVKAVELERRTVWSQRVQENSTLIIESMAREIRVSNITSGDSVNCSATTLSMVHPVYGNITYSLQGQNIQKQVGSVNGLINSSDVQIANLKFCITGSGANDDQPSKITILVSIKSSKGSPPVSANLETTVTSRDITSELTNL